jgi:hypothetical protein
VGTHTSDVQRSHRLDTANCARDSHAPATPALLPEQTRLRMALKPLRLNDDTLERRGIGAQLSFPTLYGLLMGAYAAEVYQHQSL